MALGFLLEWHRYTADLWQIDCSVAYPQWAGWEWGQCGILHQSPGGLLVSRWQYRVETESLCFRVRQAWSESQNDY